MKINPSDSGEPLAVFRTVKEWSEICMALSGYATNSNTGLQLSADVLEMYGRFVEEIQLKFKSRK